MACELAFLLLQHVEEVLLDGLDSSGIYPVVELLGAQLPMSLCSPGTPQNGHKSTLPLAGREVMAAHAQPLHLGSQCLLNFARLIDVK